MEYDLSVGKASLFAALSLTLYAVYGAVWRLYFSPLAKYPGPKLAALTQWYEFYYDIIKWNRFSWEIERLHDVYGTLTCLFKGIEEY